MAGAAHAIIAPFAIIAVGVRAAIARIGPVIVIAAPPPPVAAIPAIVIALRPPPVLPAFMMALPFAAILGPLPPFAVALTPVFRASLPVATIVVPPVPLTAIFRTPVPVAAVIVPPFPPPFSLVADG